MIRLGRLIVNADPAHAVEMNLRCRGTMHTFMASLALIDGIYGEERCLFH